MGCTVEVRTDELARGVLVEAWPRWLTVLAVADRLPVYRSKPSVQQHLKAMHEAGELERRVRDAPGAPFEYRVVGEGSGIGDSARGGSATPSGMRVNG